MTSLLSINKNKDFEEAFGTPFNFWRSLPLLRGNDINDSRVIDNDAKRCPTYLEIL